MAETRKVAASLKKSARAINRVPDAAVQAAAIRGVEIAREVGGSFFGGRVPLIAEVEKKGSKSDASALLVGKPAGAWVIKGEGRKGFGPVNREALRIGSRAVIRESVGPAGPARSGRRRWGLVIERVGEEFPDIAVKELDKALGEA